MSIHPLELPFTSASPVAVRQVQLYQAPRGTAIPKSITYAHGTTFGFETRMVGFGNNYVLIPLARRSGLWAAAAAYDAGLCVPVLAGA